MIPFLYPRPEMPEILSHRIYALLDPRNHSIRYIGKTKFSLTRRLQMHRDEMLRKNNRRYKNKWMRALAKSGLQPLIFLIEECSSNEASRREQFWIAYGRHLGLKLTNSTDGGEGVVGLRLSPEHRAAVAESNKRRVGKPISAEHRQAISVANKGKVFSAEHRANIARAVRASGQSERARKLGLSNKGRKRTDEFRRGISERQKGRQLSASHRAAISAGHKRRLAKKKDLL